MSRMPNPIYEQPPSPPSLTDAFAQPVGPAPPGGLYPNPPPILGQLGFGQGGPQPVAPGPPTQPQPTAQPAPQASPQAPPDPPVFAPHYQYGQPVHPGVPLAAPPAEAQVLAAPTAPLGQAPPQPPASPEDKSLRDYAREMGLDVSQFPEETTDEQILAHLVRQDAMARQYAQMGDYIQLGRQVAQQGDAWREFLQSRQGSGQPAAPADHPQAGPADGGPPELDSVARRWIALAQQGELTEEHRQLIPADVQAQIRQWERWQRNRAAQLLQDPVAMVREPLAKDFDSRYLTKEEAKRQFQEWQNALYMQAKEQQLESLMYQHDPAGNRILDPATGQALLTPYGVQRGQYEQALAQSGVTDPALRSIWIDKLLPSPSGRPNGQQAAAPVSQPVAPAAQAPAPTPQQAFLDEAARLHAQFPGYPAAVRGGTVGMPPLGFGPNDLAPPMLSDVERELHGAYAPH